VELKSTEVAMLRRNEVELMMERAENLGIHLKFDCGLILVEQTATATTFWGLLEKIVICGDGD
jgi:hypothetical protein